MIDDDVVITDSHAICSYLCDKYAIDDSLYPKDIRKRATVNARLHFDNGFLFSRLRFMCEPVLFFKHKHRTDRAEYIQQSWPLVEGFLENGNYLCGNEMTIADLCAVTVISSVTDNAPIDPQKYPKLTAWFKRMTQLPYYHEKNAAGAAEIQTMFKHKAAINQNL